MPADSDDDDDDEDGKQKVSGPSREDVYAAFHKGTNSSKKKKQASWGGHVAEWQGLGLCIVCCCEI